MIVRVEWWRRLYTLWRRLYSFVEEVIHTVVIIVSAQSKELGFGFFRLGLTLDPGFGACWDRGLGTWTRA